MVARRKAALASLALSLLFIVIYGFCGWVTSFRQTSTFYFAWERQIPFIALFIIPYMSIDLFFIAAPFLLKSNRELRTFAARITAAILIAGICFLAFPLKFGFDRPPTAGPLGTLFNHFRQLDPPFNEFPSLHITLSILLAECYWQHTRGILRLFLMAWFALIFISPLFTYQHHFIDILGGFFLALYCRRLIPEQHPASPNRRVASYYAVGTLLLVLLATVWRPWSLILLWPAAALALATTAYLFSGAAIYHKQNGKLSFATWLLLWPLLLGQRVSLHYYATHCAAYNALTPHLWIGRKLSINESRAAIAKGITAVLDLTCEFSEPLPFRTLPYLQLPILDLTAPTPAQIQQAITFINQHSPNGIVYLHCKIGYSRTAAIAAAYLISTGKCPTTDAAIAELQTARPTLIIRPEALAALRQWEKSLHQSVLSPAPG